MSYDNWKSSDLADDYDEPNYGEDEEDMITAKELLVKAKATLREKGWTQGRYRNDCGQCCMYGAIYDAAGVLDELGFRSKFNDIPKELKVAIDDADRALMTATPNSNPIQFNDEEGRKVGEVLEVFDKAIALTDGGVA